MLAQPDMILLGALVMAVGLFSGVISGLLGVGGGIVIVPALYHVFSYLGIDPSVRMHLAVGPRSRPSSRRRSARCAAITSAARSTWR